MSGAEAILVLGVISSIISIVDGIKQVCDAATSTEGLPEAFREVAGRLPIVANILGSAKQYIGGGNVDEESCKGVKPIVEACEKKANTLDGLFRKVIPANGASRGEIYLSAVRTLGKGNQLETLMKGMLEDVQLLTSERIMKIGTKAEQEQLANAITEAAREIIPSTDILEGSEEDKCLAALFLTDPRDDRGMLVSVKGSRVKGTCEWIKTNPFYNAWLRSNSQLLWLSGGPGKGKTMLSIFLAEELERTANDAQNALFLQYFCDNKDERRNTGVNIVRGLIWQLLRKRRELFVHILPSLKDRDKNQLMTSFETLWRILETMLRDPILGDTYCVLDGLDECNEASLEVLLSKFKALFMPENRPSHHFKLIVVSRDLPECIPKLLLNTPRIRLDPDADTEVNNDIYQFIEAKVDELSIYGKYQEPLRIHIKTVFQDRAQGTFLWVALVAKALEKYKPTEVKSALDQFPPGLDELYARMLLQIDVNRRELAAKILLWVVMAARPLTLSELGTAVGINTKPSDDFSLVQAARDQVLYCGSFLTIEVDEVRLIHQSAKDYLLRKTPDSNPKLEVFRIEEEIGNLELARRCLEYLQNGAFAKGKIDLSKDTAHLRAFPLISYTTLHWPDHARASAHSGDIFNLSLSFYQKRSILRKSWFETYWAAEEPWRELPTSFTLLHLASYLGILPLAKNLVQKGWVNRVSRSRNMNKRDELGRMALHWAAEGGHEGVARLLLDKGADVEAKAKDGGTALHLAAQRGHEGVARLLLDKGADVEAKAKDGGTALHLAAQGGHEGVARLLLDKGADVEAKDKYGWTALHWAAEGGHEGVARLLLDKGADVEAKAKDGGTALHLAAQHGHEGVARLLLDKGADVEAKDKYGWTALHWAAERGHEGVARLLLDKGADVEAKAKDGWTALHLAAQGGHEGVARLLLDKGADVEAKDKYGWTALHLAAERGHEGVVRLINISLNS